MSPCPDCTVNHCTGKKFYDLRGQVVSIGWRCGVCDHRWMVAVRPPSLLRRFIRWCWAPLL